jgi:formate dehydrogenase iron-sulfur subunit
MFEVSWCVGLYVTVLLFEFLPVPFERWGLRKAKDIWQRWSCTYVACALTLFVYLLSRQLAYALSTALLFSFLAWAFRARDKKSEPIMLAIAAVTLSTMHQSSLGSLFLLLPDQLAPQWWSPVMPVSFFLSSVAAGTSLFVLIELWMAKAWGRRLQISQLAARGKISFWSLLSYWAFRLGDMVVRGQFVFGKTGTPFRGRAPPWRYSSCAPTWPRMVASPPHRALSWHASCGLRCGFQSGECSAASHGLKRSDAPGCTGVLHSVCLRVGHFCWA